MSNPPNFFEKVYEVAKLIPEGRVTSYGAIAQYLGVKSAARMVGWAMNASHLDPVIPAHRVLNKAGILSGKHHFGAPNEMQIRLEKEGIIIQNNQVKDLEKHFWNPEFELI